VIFTLRVLHACGIEARSLESRRMEARDAALSEEVRAPTEALRVADEVDGAILRVLGDVTCRGVCGDGASRREASIGSEGHPHSCSLPCKFAGRPQGCDKGSSCPRCHLCDWRGRGLDPHPKNKDGTPWVYQAPPEKRTKQKWVRHCVTQGEGSPGGHICQLNVHGGSGEYVELLSLVAATALEESLLCHFAPGYALHQSPEAMLELRRHLMSEGFTAAPHSSELIGVVSRMPACDIDMLRRVTMPPGAHSSPMVTACLAQLRQVLPRGAIVLGPYKLRARTCAADNASRLHKDDVLLTLGDVATALLPPPAPDLACACGGFDHYESFRAHAAREHPSLELPPCPVARSDPSSLAREIVRSVRRYNEGNAREDELLFDNVNVWIPRDTKQLVLLPLVPSRELQYPLCPEDVERLKARLAGEFRALPRGVALVFFGQSLLHQALMGRHFDCGSGSVEGRYLVLTPRKYAHRGSLRDHLAEDTIVGIQI
jgi:hypothetical protein